MKFWFAYGSEHSANLTIVGRFASVEAAETTEQKIVRLREWVRAELEVSDWDEVDAEYPDELMDLVRELHLWSLSRSDIEQFLYDFGLQRSDNVLEISTDEVDVQGFIKLMIESDARIELFTPDAVPAEVEDDEVDEG